MFFLQNNLRVLQERYKDIEDILKPYQDSQKTKAHYRAELSKNNLYTCWINDEGSYYLHSRYDPQKEAQRFAEENYDSDYDVHILYGFGFGHIVEALLNLMTTRAKLIVYESNLNIFALAMEYCNLEQILRDPRLSLFLDSEHESFILHFANQLTSNEAAKLIVHGPSARAIEKKNAELKQLLQGWNLTVKNYKKYAEEINENYLHNKTEINDNVDILFNMFKGTPALIVGAGPSLDKAIPFLDRIKSKAMIFACGTALKSLLNAGIEPDIFMITDPTIDTINQINGLEELDIPAVFLSTANYATVSSYKGPRMIAYQKQYKDNDKLYKNTVETGGSVVTTIFDICIRMGCELIAFVGVDLAYTNNMHHASNTEYGTDNVISSQGMLKQAYNNDGKLCFTTTGFLTHKKWLENKIRSEAELKVFNCSEGGLSIEGTTECRIDHFGQYIDEVNYCYKNKILEIIKSRKQV